MIPGIGSSSAANNPLANTALAKSGFSKDTFLHLLVTQLKNQDPLNPQESHEFVAQLAQFSSLEQMANMSSNMQTILEMSVTNLIGRTATVLDPNAPGGLVTGVIEGIQYYADGPAVKIAGKDYSFTQVQSIDQ